MVRSRHGGSRVAPRGVCRVADGVSCAARLVADRLSVAGGVTLGIRSPRIALRVTFFHP